jgi:hypothetical protein
MSTFLQLCEDVARESGAAGRAPVSVVGQTGRAAKVVDWVRDAWIEIQNQRDSWSFLQGEWTGTLTPGTAVYTAASFEIPRFARWGGDTPVSRSVTLRDPDQDAGQEAPITQLTDPDWRRRYFVGAHAQGRPVHYAILPDDSIAFGATPDKAYLMRGEYRKSPQILEANGDIPDMPERFHRAIVWQAIMFMAEHDEGAFAIQTAQRRLNPIMHQMHRDLLPRMTFSAVRPLA